MRSAFAGGLVALALGGPAFAGPIVNGDVSDWGITVKDGNLSNFLTPSVAGTVLGSTFFFAREDQNDFAGDSGYVGPNYGGQNYDVEFMGVALKDGQLYIAIVTGQRPDNGLERFSPGDIRIVANNGHVYGIEVGGGAGGAGAGVLTQIGDPLGSTYTLNSSGFTLSHGTSARTVGSIWQDPNWLMDPIPPATAVQLADDGSGKPMGTATYIYTRDGDLTKQHSVIELSLALATFGDATALDIYWAPSCGNDVLVVYDDLLPARVPEPGTLAALGIGLIGLAMVRRRR